MFNGNVPSDLAFHSVNELNGEVATKLGIFDRLQPLIEGAMRTSIFDCDIELSLRAKSQYNTYMSAGSGDDLTEYVGVCSRKFLNLDARGEASYTALKKILPNFLLGNPIYAQSRLSQQSSQNTIDWFYTNPKASIKRGIDYDSDDDDSNGDGGRKEGSENSAKRKKTYGGKNTAKSSSSDGNSNAASSSAGGIANDGRNGICNEFVLEELHIEALANLKDTGDDKSLEALTPVFGPRIAKHMVENRK
jgi:hypothetical protein